MCPYVCVCAHDCVGDTETWCTCAKQMTPMPVWVFPRWGWCMDHVLPSALGHVGSVFLGSSLNVALNLHWARKRFTSSTNPLHHLSWQGDECSGPVSFKHKSDVICLTLDTTINLSCPMFFVWNHTYITWYMALTTCIWDKRLDLSKFSYVVLMWGIKLTAFVTLPN